MHIRITFAQCNRDIFLQTTFCQPITAGSDVVHREMSLLTFGMGVGGFASVPHAHTHTATGIDPFIHKHNMCDVYGLEEALKSNGGGSGTGSSPVSIEGDIPIHVAKNGNSYAISHLPPEREQTAEDFNRYNNIDATGHVVKDYHPHGGRPNIDFSARDLLASGSVGSADFMAGLLGAGWNINAAGAGEMNSLILRTFLSTPELVKNQIRIIGSQAWLTENGVVASVTANPFLTTGLTTKDGQRLGTRYTGDYFVRFHDENANKWFRYDDILRGIYNYDDGFRTLYLRVVRELGTGYILRPLNGLAPTAEMVLARQGNFSDPARQGAIYFNSAEAYIRILSGVNGIEITNDNLVAQLGNLRGLRIDGVTLPADGLYAPGLAVDARNVAGLSAMFSVLEGEINSKVSAGDICSTINQTAQAVKIKAEKIELEGLVRADELFVDGLISADKINTQNLVAKNINTRKNSTGRGVEITQGFNEVTLYDASNNNVGGITIGNADQGVASQLHFMQATSHGYLRPFEVRFTSNSHSAAAVYGYDGITLPPGAAVDISGTLLWAQGLKDGGYKFYKGARKHATHTITKQSTGTYRVYHSIGHEEYAVNVAIESTDGWCGVWKWKNKTATYIDIVICDMGSTPVNKNFDVTLIGEN